MEFLSQMTGTLSGTLGYFIPFILVLSVIVVVHEYGHYIVGRWCGVRILTFSVGFGPELFGRVDKRGTRWKVCAIPLGGYVKFFGDMNEASVGDSEALKKMSDEERAVAFPTQPLHKRAAIVAAGPVFNFIFAIAVYFALFATLGQPITPPEVDEIVSGSAAEQAELMKGDVITEINGRKIRSFTDLQRLVSTSAGEELLFKIERNGELIQKTIIPMREEIDDAYGGKREVGMLGIRKVMSGAREYEKMSLIQAAKGAVYETWFITERTLNYLKRIVTGKESAKDLGGPIRIAEASGKAAEHGILPLINLTALLSISIGLLNLFPIPLLDGGHLMFYLYEAVRGKPLHEKAQDVFFKIGFAIVISLMIFATFNDISSLISR